MKVIVFLSLLLTYFSPVTLIAHNHLSNNIYISKELIPLLDLLKKKGFKTKFEIPPKKGVYGLFHGKSKTLWISPITFELGIARQTILHEATHAAQSCPSGELTTIGFKLPLSPFIKNEIHVNLIKNYKTNQYLIEEEAFSLQGNKNGINLLMKALSQRCNDI